jgi:hypothetical protein
VIRADFSPAQRASLGAHVNRPGSRVDIHRSLRSVGDRNVSGGAEERLDLDYGAAHVNSIQKPSCPGNGDGREYAQNAERDRKLDQGERVPQRSAAMSRGSIA